MLENDLIEMDRFVNGVTDMPVPPSWGRIKTALEELGTTPNKQSTKLKMCEECGVNPADLPNTKCCGCNSYYEHF